MALSKKKRAAQYKDLDLDVRSEIADLFRLLGDPSRLGIVYTCLGEPVSAGDIARMLKISPSLTSHHLRLLKAARLVRSKRKGNRFFILQPMRMFGAFYSIWPNTRLSMSMNTRRAAHECDV